MLLKISIFLIFSFLLFSCSNDKKLILVSTLVEKKETSNSNNSEKVSKIKETIIIKPTIKKIKKTKIKVPIYYIGGPYFIDGVKYIPKEDYNYTETGLASFYGKELHRLKTINNEFNKVTELLARHKTLPLPSVVKITNLENGLSVVVRINDRGPQNNARLIEVSRKVAQLLRFYKSKITKVKVEILPDPSKQLKIVTQSMSNPEFNQTIKAAPTEEVSISDLGESIAEESIQKTEYEQPIELGFENISKSDLYVKISGFNSYQEASKVKEIKELIEREYKITIQKENDGYSILFGPMLNNEADNLFQIFAIRGYKHLEMVIN